MQHPAHKFGGFCRLVLAQLSFPLIFTGFNKGQEMLGSATLWKVKILVTLYIPLSTTSDRPIHLSGLRKGKKFIIPTGSLFWCRKTNDVQDLAAINPLSFAWQKHHQHHQGGESQYSRYKGSAISKMCSSSECWLSRLITAFGSTVYCTVCRHGCMGCLYRSWLYCRV